MRGILSNCLEIYDRVSEPILRKRCLKFFTTKTLPNSHDYYNNILFQATLYPGFLPCKNQCRAPGNEVASSIEIGSSKDDAYGNGRKQ